MDDRLLARNIRHLRFLEAEVYQLQRHSEKYIEGVPVGASEEVIAEYVEPFIAKLGEFREQITDTRRKLRQFGVTVPQEWHDIPIDLAARWDDKTGGLELDPCIVARWQAARSSIDATIEQLQCAPQEPDGPCGAYQWRCGGKLTADSMQPAAWKMAKHLWGHRARAATFDELMEPVYDDRNHLADESAFGSLRRAANTFFANNKIPYEIKIRRRLVSLVALE